MRKDIHEIRDPIHNFIRLDTTERKVVNSVPFQRLRHIHQLALTSHIYPGATHKRFEHSLGVMELASRIFDVVTNSDRLAIKVRGVVPIGDRLQYQYWRRVLRMAALCHDLGHLPFSHAAEDHLLKGRTHEDITVDIIKSPEMMDIWGSMKPSLDAADVAKIAVGPKKMVEEEFSEWEILLSEIITSNVFGADRMDYLLRDGHHAGVIYGNFDHYRLIDTMRILPREDRGSTELELGLEEGGLYSAEALLLSRYFMFSQLYLHPVRCVYDLHLKDFMNKMFCDGFPVEPREFIKWSDNEIWGEIYKAYWDMSHIAHKEASIIVDRQHFKLLFSCTKADQKLDFKAEKTVFKAACLKFGEDNVRWCRYSKEGKKEDFPVLLSNGKIASSLHSSDVLNTIPSIKAKFVFIAKDHFDEAKRWIEEERDSILKKGSAR